MMKLWMAPAGLHVEPADPADARELARIHAAGFYRGWPEADFDAFFEDNAARICVACDARRRIAGFILVRVAGDEAELLTIAVDPRWRGRGVGLALLRAAIEDLRYTPARRMFLEVDEHNQPARRLYAREGFAAVGSRKGYYARPDGTAATALVLSRDLG